MLFAGWRDPFEIVWNVAAVLIVVYAVWLVWGMPSECFKHGQRTKVFWLCIVVALGISFQSLYLPIGAVWGITRYQRIHSAKWVEQVGRVVTRHPGLTFLGMVAIFALERWGLGWDWTNFLIMGVAFPAFLVINSRQRSRSAPGAGRAL
jgi:hypothetical protein